MTIVYTSKQGVTGLHKSKTYETRYSRLLQHGYPNVAKADIILQNLIYDIFQLLSSKRPFFHHFTSEMKILFPKSM